MALHTKTAHELRDLIQSKEVSAEEITESVLNQIDAVENKVEAYVTIQREKALEQAREIDRKIKVGLKGDLVGIPMALKDNMCTEGIKTTCGSKILGDFIPPYDATVTKKLKEAGTILLGKVNMDEFAMGSSNENSHFKATRNPWDLDKIPGGSSGGSAAAVAADEAVFTLGSDTGGSIRQPAHCCGVVGMKPTYGAVSRYGLVAYASSLDQIGPITKDVEDMALVLNSIAGYDAYDSTSANVEIPDYKKALVNDMKGMRVALPREYFVEGLDAEVDQAMKETVKKLESLGAVIEEVSLPYTEYALPAYYIIASAEASSNLARYDGIKYGFRTENFEDLLDLYKESRSQGFGDEVKRRIMLGTYVLSSGYYDAYYKKAQQVRTLIMKDFERVFNDFDIIMTPTAPTPAFKIGEKISDPLAMYLSDVCTVPINIAGLPALSMNCAFDQAGMPIGVQFIGKAFDESTILRAAYTYEQNTKEIRSKKPEFKGL